MYRRKYDQHEGEMARPPAVEKGETVRLALNVGSVGLTDDQFLRLCSDNRDLRIEMTAQGELIIVPPQGSKTGQRTAEITMRLAIWTRQDGTGVCFGTDTGFTLPNGAKGVRMPHGLRGIGGTACRKIYRKNLHQSVLISSLN